MTERKQLKGIEMRMYIKIIGKHYAAPLASCCNVDTNIFATTVFAFATLHTGIVVASGEFSAAQKMKISKALTFE